MKRKGLSILLSALLVMILTVSFFVPVEASYNKYTFTNKSFTSDKSVFLTSDSASFKDLYNPDNVMTYQLVYVADSADGSFVFDMPFTLWQFNNNSAVVADADTMQFNFTGFNVSSTLTSSGSVKPIVQVTSVELLGPSGQSASIRLPSAQASSKCVFSLPMYPGYPEVHDFFTVRLHVQYHCGFKTENSGTSDYPLFSVLDSYGTFKFGYSFSSLSISFYNSQDVKSSDINNQTNSINNKIQQETQKQTDTLTDGYDNSALNQSNSNLSGAITDYDNTESQITDSSVANIDAAEFQLPSGNAALTASLSFGATFLQSLFVNMGDWSLLVTVSLSLALGLMLIGWFRYR